MDQVQLHQQVFRRYSSSSEVCMHLGRSGGSLVYILRKATHCLRHPKTSSSKIDVCSDCSRQQVTYGSTTLTSHARRLPLCKASRFGFTANCGADGRRHNHPREIVTSCEPRYNSISVTCLHLLGNLTVNAKAGFVARSGLRRIPNLS